MLAAHPDPVNASPPVAVIVEISDAGDLVVECPYCGELHRHGGAGGRGLRTNHCAEGRHLADYVLVDAR